MDKIYLVLVWADYEEEGQQDWIDSVWTEDKKEEAIQRAKFIQTLYDHDATVIEHKTNMFLRPIPENNWCSSIEKVIVGWKRYNA